MAEGGVWAVRGAEILVREGGDFAARAEPGSSLLSCRGLALPEPADRYALPPYAGRPELDGMALLYPEDAPAPNGWEWRPLRAAVMALPEDAWLPAARAMAFMRWREATRYCGRCGGRNQDKADEPARVCSACGALSFPRISPAVLAVVRRGDKLLLARNAASRLGFWSLIAGFVEPGERFEDCVRREVREEVGLDIRVDGYLGSQPWPFPDQLMIGFKASWASGELAPDGVEIAEAGWFGPDDHPPLPNPGSLSRRLIDAALADIAAGR
ncbi:MAG: NAD(+) diphosphatase [Spirochaetia bacterium]|nr:NAD(+) diphosphatase [Spirochaetia bacterium]